MHQLPTLALTFLIGICSTFLYVPSMLLIACLVILGLATLIFIRNRFLIACLSALLGCCHMSYHVHAHKNQILPTALEGTPIKVIGTINSVVEETELHSLRFLFEITSPQSLARRIRLSWYNPKALPEAGDTWEFTVKLKRPHAPVNPAGFDQEKHQFQQRISAVGTIVNKNADYRLLAKSHTINWWRQHLSQKIETEVKSNFSGIIAALLLGNRSGISAQQKLVLDKTGTTHLMAISGLHLGFTAGFAMLVVRLIWYLVPIARLEMSLPIVSAVAALGASCSYALLAGFGVATQRALLMLGIWLLADLLRRQISKLHAFCLALFTVLIWDPLVVLSAGFWLSFWAVACLLYAFVGRRPLNRPWRWLYPQLVLGFGLLPLSLMFFGQNAWIAPVANLVAVPWVGFAVVPFCLIGCFKVAAYNLSLVWPLLEYLHNFPAYNWSMPETYLWIKLVSTVVAFIWLFSPRSIPGRYWAVLGFLPLFILDKSAAIPYRQAEFTLLDVGQGLAAVVRTRSHTLVYDTGTPGQGSMVIAPYLRQIGSPLIDSLVISHADSDHSGGVKDLLDHFSASQFLTSDPGKFDHALACLANQQWEWDGVKFKILHPQITLQTDKRNNNSCVLLVEANDQKLLLTGDIESPAEAQLIAQYGKDLQADVLVVPHHGSRTSSSEQFIDQVDPGIALIPVGYRSRYGHPKPQVIARYMQREIPLYSSDRDGAISIRLGLSTNDPLYLRPRCQREAGQQPFWRIQIEP